jgi:hypothetical protein
MANDVVNDDLEVQNAAIAENDERNRRKDVLIHKLFRQNPDGVELLELWMKWSLLLRPIVRWGETHDPYDIGIEQGRQEFIRNIFLTCEAKDKGIK